MINKILLTTILVTFATTVLADENVSVSYSGSTYKDNFLNSEGNNGTIRMNYLLNNNFKIGGWVNKSKYDHDTLGIDKNSYGISFGKDGFYMDLGSLKSTYRLSPATVKNSSGTYSYNSKENYNGTVFNIGWIGESEPSKKYFGLTGKLGYEYSSNSYDSNDSIFKPETENNVKLTLGVGKIFNFQKFKMQLGWDVKIISYNMLYSESKIEGNMVYVTGYKTKGEGRIGEGGSDIYIKFGLPDRTDYILTLGIKKFEYLGSVQKSYTIEPITTGRDIFYFNIGHSF